MSFCSGGAHVIPSTYKLKFSKHLFPSLTPVNDHWICSRTVPYTFSLRGMFVLLLYLETSEGRKRNTLISFIPYIKSITKHGWFYFLNICLIVTLFAFSLAFPLQLQQLTVCLSPVQPMVPTCKSPGLQGPSTVRWAPHISSVSTAPPLFCFVHGLLLGPHSIHTSHSAFSCRTFAPAFVHLLSLYHLV